MIPRQPMKPQSASLTDADVYRLKYPVLGSWKFDGVLCLSDNAAYTAKLELIQNPFVQRILSRPEYAGLQGELIVGSPFDKRCFNITSRALRRGYGEPNFKFYVFDTFLYPDRPYIWRMAKIKDKIIGRPHLIIVDQVELKTPQEVFNFRDQCVLLGLEGCIVRSPMAWYKEGRGTWKKQELLKIKPREDDEAEIVGFTEQLGNENEAILDARGLTTRSSHASGRFGKDTLGAIILRSHNPKLPWCGRDFPCSRGNMTAAEAKYMWEHKSEFLHKIGTYSYLKVGSLYLPRSAQWKGLRDLSDITDF